MEAESIFLALRRVNKIGAENVFPGLKPIAIGSRYGYNSHWSHYQNDTAKVDGGRVGDACFAELSVLLASLHLQQYCARDPMGALGLQVLGSTRHDNPKIPRCARTYHLSKLNRDLPISFGAPIRWVYDEGSEPGWEVESFRALYDGYHGRIKGRQIMLRYQKDPPKYIDIEI